MTLVVKSGHEVAELVFLPKGRLNMGERAKKWVSVESLKAFIARRDLTPLELFEEMEEELEVF